ncbi:MAG: DUF4358 domain-containing protein [Oscillospiraceae bacterium]
MKRAIAILLAAVCLLSLCACGGDGKKIDISAKDLTAAALQSTGLEGTDLFVASDDESFANRFYYYYGIETDKVRDYAIAYSSASRPEEISVLVAADGVDVEVLTDALDARCRMLISSFELYSPESVEMLNNAIIFTEGDCAVLIVAPDPASVRDKMQELLGDADGTGILAGEFYAAQEASVPEYDYSKPVPASEPKGEDWFGDAAFIGDSRMKGIMNFAKFEYAADFSHVGLTVADVFTKPYIETASGTVTVSEALQGGTYGKIYMMTGLNELGWYDTDKFIEYYGDMVDLAKQTHPEAQIYVIGIMPVGAKATAEQAHLTNDRVQMFNGLILGMCEAKQVYFVDGFEAVASNGSLPDDASPDGVHMEPGYCKMLTDYLLSHTVEA